MVDHSMMLLGKKPRKYDRRNMKLGDFIPEKLPTAEMVIDYSNNVKDWGMMLNNQLGCCTCAAACHTIQLATMNDAVNNPGMVTLDDSVVLDLYERWCGYDPKDPSTDQGGIELEVLNFWRAQGIAGHKLLGYAAINRANYRQLQYAISEFNVYIGVELPISAQKQETWDVVPDDGGVWGGHAVNLTGYDDSDPESIIPFTSWSKHMAMTKRFWDKYVSEAYALMLEDFEGSHSRGREGFDLVAWNKNLSLVTA